MLIRTPHLALSAPFPPPPSLPSLNPPVPPPDRRIALERGVDGLPPTLVIVTDMGKSNREQGNCIVKEAVSAMMAFWEAPFRCERCHVVHMP